MLFSEAALRRALEEYLDHYHKERNHQSFENRRLFPEKSPAPEHGEITSKERLGGLLKFYYRQAG